MCNRVLSCKEAACFAKKSQETRRKVSMLVKVFQRNRINKLFKKRCEKDYFGNLLMVTEAITRHDLLARERGELVIEGCVNPEA